MFILLALSVAHMNPFIRLDGSGVVAHDEIIRNKSGLFKWSIFSN